MKKYPAGVTPGSKSPEAGNVAWAKALKISAVIAMEITKTSALSGWWMNGSAPFTQAVQKTRREPHEY
jgi:hypothetical protein